MADDSQGALTKMAVSAGSSPYTWNNAAERYEFDYEDLAKKGRIVGGRGISGSRSSRSERTRTGQYEVGGRIAMKISPNDMEKWLPRIFGGALTNSAVALAETIPSFGVLVNRVADTFEYQNCYVNRAVLRGKAGPNDEEPEVLDLILDVVAKDESTSPTWPVSEPALGVGGDDAPFIFSDLTLSLKSGNRCCTEFALMVDNHLESRFCNSLTATSITPADRTVLLRAVTPFTSDEVDLYGQALAGSTATLNLTNGNTSTTFTFATLQTPDQSPTVKGKRSIPLILDMVARQVNTTKEISATVDSTV